MEHDTPWVQDAIIDTHTHFYDPARPQGVPWPPPDNTLLYRTVLPEQYRRLAPEGVAGTVVVEASSWLEDNQWVLDLAAQDPFILGLVGHLHPGSGDFGAELARFAANPLFRGIRCGGTYFLDVERGSFIADMDVLAARDLELDALVACPHLDGVVKLARCLPQLRIVIDHIAHTPVDGQPLDAAWLDWYHRLAECPQVHIKVSALMEQSTVQPAPRNVDFYRPTLDALWAAFGPDRLIYGSNWPVCERAGDRVAAGLELTKTYFSEKGQTAYARVLWKNARAVYRLGDL